MCGSVYSSKLDTGIARYRKTPAVDERILKIALDNFSTNFRVVGCDLGVNQTAIVRIFHEDRNALESIIEAMNPDDYLLLLSFTLWYCSELNIPCR